MSLGRLALGSSFHQGSKAKALWGVSAELPAPRRVIPGGDQPEDGRTGGDPGGAEGPGDPVLGPAVPSWASTCRRITKPGAGSAGGRGRHRMWAEGLPEPRPKQHLRYPGVRPLGFSARLVRARPKKPKLPQPPKAPNTLDFASSPELPLFSLSNPRRLGEPPEWNN